jgi:hypothetical protein
MSPHRLINIALAVAIGVLLSTSYLLDGPDDIATARAVAADLGDAIKTAQVGK